MAVVTGMFFGGITGSAIADAAAVGSVLIPAMKKKNYDPAFSAALAAAAGAVGPIIPPSIPMIIYAVIANTSVASLFLGRHCSRSALRPHFDGLFLFLCEKEKLP